MCVIENEIWKPIEGYENLYEISNMGRVKSLPKKYSHPKDKIGRIMRLNLNKKNNRIGVILSKNGIQKRYLVHRLVAMAFIENPNNYLEINHKDEDPTNNKASNLEWCNHRYNMLYSNIPKKMKAAAVKKQQKAVLMYDKNGNFIREFESATIAAQAIGNYQQNVSACCYGKLKKISGYKFKFKK